MDDKLVASGALAPELLDKIEHAAVSAARVILTGPENSRCGRSLWSGLD